MLKFWKCSCYFWVFVFIIFACSSCFASPIIFFSLFRNNNIADLWKFAITTTVTTSTWLGLVLILGTVISCWASDRSPFAAKFNAPHLELPPLFPPHTRPPSLSHILSIFPRYQHMSTWTCAGLGLPSRFPLFRLCFSACPWDLWLVFSECASPLLPSGFFYFDSGSLAVLLCFFLNHWVIGDFGDLQAPHSVWHSFVNTLTSHKAIQIHTVVPLADLNKTPLVLRSKERPP